MASADAWRVLGSTQIAGSTEVRLPGACRTPEFELTSDALLQVHRAKEPTDRRERDGIELPQCRRRLNGEQVLEPSPRLLEPVESRLKRANVVGAKLRRRTGVLANELTERVDTSSDLVQRLGKPQK